MTIVALNALVIALLLGPFQSPAQTAKPPAARELPSLEQIISHYVQAVGGKKALLKIKTIREKGTVTFPAIQQKGEIEFVWQTPDHYLFGATIEGYGTTQTGFDGKQGWSIRQDSKLRDVTGLELSQLRREADFYRPLHLSQIYKSLSVKSVEKVNNRDCYAVEAATPEGGVETLYFDSETGLLTKIDRPMASTLGTEPMQVYYDDYREVAGVQVPFTTRQVAPGITTVIKLFEVKENVAIDETRFRKPGAES